MSSPLKVSSGDHYRGHGPPSGFDCCRIDGTRCPHAPPRTASLEMAGRDPLAWLRVPLALREGGRWPNPPRRVSRLRSWVDERLARVSKCSADELASGYGLSATDFRPGCGLQCCLPAWVKVGMDLVRKLPASAASYDGVIFTRKAVACFEGLSRPAALA